MNKQRKNNIFNMKKKQVIRLTESDLHRIIKESVRRVLTESEEYTVIGDKKVPLEQAKVIARQELINHLQNNEEVVKITSYEGKGYGTLEIETDNGWYFLAEDLPVYLEIDTHSSHSPATRLDPEESQDVEGHVEGIDFIGDISCFPASELPFNQQKPIMLNIDDELSKLMEEKCKPEKDIHDALLAMEEYEIDHQPEPEYERDDY